MQKSELDQMDIQDLKQLRKDVDRAIVSYEKRRRDEARAAAEKAAAEYGVSLADIVGGTRSKSGTRAARPAKYRHPENPELTWSGRGRQPHWIKERLEAGQSLDEFAI